MSDILAAALELHAAGLSVVPVASDGSKRPAIDWKANTSARADDRTVGTWFNGTSDHGVGVVCGAVSGNLEMLELEGRAAHHLPDLQSLAVDSGLGDLWATVTAGWVELSPSGGIHFHYRVDGAVAGNTKLARRPSTDAELFEWGERELEKAADIQDADLRRARGIRIRNTTAAQVPQVLAETRGEGGFVVVAPTPGTHHPTGRPWARLRGGPATLPTLTTEQRDAIHALVRTLDEMPPPAAPATPPRAPQERADGSLQPGDDYEARTDWADILVPHGWVHVTTRGRTRYWRRPGKNDGFSATTGHADDRDRLYVFTSSTEFEAEHPYTKFGAYALLEHAGDHTAAARELGRTGFGETPRHPTVTGLGLDGLIIHDDRSKPWQTPAASPKGSATTYSANSSVPPTTAASSSARSSSSTAATSRSSTSSPTSPASPPPASPAGTTSSATTAPATASAPDQEDTTWTPQSPATSTGESSTPRDAAPSPALSADATGVSSHSGPGSSAPDAPTPSATESDEPAPLPPSWQPIDLGPYLDGTYVPPAPDLLQRTDGVSLLYPGLVHDFHGESESGKSLVAQALVALEVQAGNRCVYVDFESDAGQVTGRMLALGCTPDQIRTSFVYVRPDASPYSLLEAEAWVQLLSVPARLFVLDGVTDALGQFGAASKENDDIAAWHRLVPRTIAVRTGAAVLLVDHVVKATEGRGRFAIGGQTKMAAIDGASYLVEVVDVIGKGLAGAVSLRIGKDRPGSIRPLCGIYRAADRTQEAARVTVDSTAGDGLIRVTVDPPTTHVGDRAGDDGKPFRPTGIMEKLSRLLETRGDALTYRQLHQAYKDDGGTGRERTMADALQILVDEKYVSEDRGPRNARMLRSAQVYRQRTDPQSDAYIEPLAGLVATQEELT